ncbi:MAG TPA: hypothetical protein VHX52_09955 [Steroidobacteraceae bacterium]|jgi:hypothetical protein|nr:hypothetical protein [Steroidobacteraceae bacterium]
MKTFIRSFRSRSRAGRQRGAIGYVLLWMLGVPIPLLIIFALIRGCA